ncbi:3'-5' exonuclease [Streptomyces erythrochromogenes]|uniref:3'-5' exonuclease n=1 Tax=Streptomyces erythrochromogenes TaxID=285574 RepID=UPI00224EE60F|nr:3'-5' exonuclease [Streptomyces erythrochromogenes]MCX5587604.1 3'-5' exonuclease [Streptomyces erythrochromogenes]
MSAWHLGRLAGLDFESTGVDVENDRIVTACVVQCGGGQPTVSANWLSDVDGMEIPQQASDIHGVTTERARAEGKPAGEVVADVLAALGQVIAAGVPVVAMNARFDLTLLDREARRHGLAPLPAGFPVVDPFVIDKQVDRYRKGSRKLVDLAAHYEVPIGEAHTADADAIAACRVAWRLGTRYSQLAGYSLPELHAVQVGWAAEQVAGLQEYFRRKDPNAVVRGEWPLLPIPQQQDGDQ